MVRVNSAGRSHAKSLIAAGRVDLDTPWSWGTTDENELLGDPANWTEYSKMHLGEDTSASVRTKARYKYPFGKSAKVYRSALVAIKQRASQNGATSVLEAATALLNVIDDRHSAVPDRLFKVEETR